MNIEAQNSDEQIEDVCFGNLIKRWTEAREFEWVKAANWMYGHILEQRDRNSPEPGTPENPIVGVIVDDEMDMEPTMPLIEAIAKDEEEGPQ